MQKELIPFFLLFHGESDILMRTVGRFGKKIVLLYAFPTTSILSYFRPELLFYNGHFES